MAQGGSPAPHSQQPCMGPCRGLRANPPPPLPAPPPQDVRVFLPPPPSSPNPRQGDWSAPPPPARGWGWVCTACMAAESSGQPSSAPQAACEPQDRPSNQIKSVLPEPPPPIPPPQGASGQGLVRGGSWRPEPRGRPPPPCLSLILSLVLAHWMLAMALSGLFFLSLILFPVLAHWMLALAVSGLFSGA